MAKVVHTSRGARCQSRQGKFVPNSKCGLKAHSRSTHLSESLAGIPAICHKTKNGKPSCTRVRSTSHVYKTTGGGEVWAENWKSSKRVASGKKLAGKGGARKGKFASAAKSCKGSGNFQCCMSKKLGDGKAAACRGGKASSTSTGKRRGRKSASSTSRGSKGGKSAQQKRFSTAAKKCKGSGDYRGCMKRELRK